MAKYLNEMGLALYDAKIKERLSKKADAAAVPTKISELDNDAGYITGMDVPEGAAASNTVPRMDGDASLGSETAFARGDHVHPTDTTRLAADGDGSNVTVSFAPAAGRAAPESGDALAVIVGKAAKYLADLGLLAFKDGVTAAEVGAIPAEQADQFARKSDLSSVYRYKGSVAGLADLPAEGNEAGDVWNVEATDMNYGWTGSAWDPLGQIFEIEAITSAEIDAIVNG